jgi:hypothetical protein
LEASHCKENTKREKRVDIDSVVICITKEPLLDTKRAKLSEILSFGVEISHATIDKDKVDESEIASLRN